MHEAVKTGPTKKVGSVRCRLKIIQSNTGLRISATYPTDDQMRGQAQALIWKLSLLLSFANLGRSFSHSLFNFRSSIICVQIL